MIYLIQQGSDGPVKIGFTKNSAEARLAAMQTAHAERLVLVASFEGSMDDEATLHRALARFRIRGEWFQPAPEVLRLRYEGVAECLIREQLAEERWRRWGIIDASGHMTPKGLLYLCDVEAVANPESLIAYRTGLGPIRAAEGASCIHDEVAFWTLNEEAA